MRGELIHQTNLRPFVPFVVELTGGAKLKIHRSDWVGCFGATACAVLQNDAVMILPYASIAIIRLMTDEDRPQLPKGYAR